MENQLEKIVSWAKRRGFVMPSSEIYGGISGIYDFGPYGLALKNNLKKLWWKKFVEERDDIIGLESSILMNRKVWQASGHEKGFIDELVECKKCHKRFKADDIPQDNCSQGGKHELTEPKQFNPMFKTDETYLRPETAQGMFCDFKQVLETSRQKIPFGIAQIGKSFRNEINTKDYLFRMCEFEIAEIEYFVKPGEDEKYFDEWLKNWKDFVLSLGIKEENLKEYEHPKEDLSHYSKRTVDLQYNFPFGWKELTGLANRTDYDLKSHEQSSGRDLKYYDEQTKDKYWPYVIEPTLGIERLMLAVLCDAFEEVSGGRGENGDGSPQSGEASEGNEVVLHLKPELAPVKVAVLPLVKKLSSEAKKVYTELTRCWTVEFDESGSIGRRYRRQDEIGTPYCITLDFDSLEDKKVTVRDRDTMKQERVAIDKLKNYLFTKLQIL